MRSSPLARLLRSPRVPPRTRAGLLLVAAARRLRPSAAHGIPFGAGRVFVSGDDFGTDLSTLVYVLAEEAYAGDYRQATVLDLGAHKGYAAAYALVQGARTVLSFEPEQRNLELLERAAASFRTAGADWRVRAAAVAAEEGEAELQVLSGSWGHALAVPPELARYRVGAQRVPLVALADVLAEGRALARHERLVVKLNIEGAECDAVLGTPAAAWEGVSEVFLGTHPWAVCGADDLAAHLADAGLRPAPSRHRAILRLVRA